MRDRAGRWAPAGTTRRRLLDALRGKRPEPPLTYREWLAATRPSPANLVTQSLSLRGRRVTRVVVVVRPGPGSVDDTRDSLARQIRRADLVDATAAESDGFGEWASALGTATATDAVIALRAGDRLTPDAVLQIVAAIDTNPAARLVTWDDDVWSDGEPGDPHFRSPTLPRDTLLSAFPFARSFALRGGDPLLSTVRREFGDDAGWDLLLRMDLGEDEAVHVPSILTHLADRPSPVGAAGGAVVGEHLRRHAIAASAEMAGRAVRLRWHLDRRPRVSLLVPTRHSEHLMGQLLDSLRCTTYGNWELVVVDNGGRSEAHERFYAQRAAGIEHQVLWWDTPFNYGAVNNAARRVATGEVLVLLNDDTEIRSPDWLDELVGWLSVPGIGTCGVQLLDPTGRIQHGGAIIGATGMADHRFQGLVPHSATMIGSTDWYWDSSANTAACVAITAALFDEIGGLDERFELCGSDVVLGLDVRRRGLRNVCTPHIEIVHHESATRTTAVPERDVFASYWRYAPFLAHGDPYHSPNVSLLDRNPRLRPPDEPDALRRLAPTLGLNRPSTPSTGAPASRAPTGAPQTDTPDTDTPDSCRRGGPPIPDSPDRRSISGVDWYVGTFDSPFAEMVATALALADHLRKRHGVHNRFVVESGVNPLYVMTGLTAAYPGLAEADVIVMPLASATTNLPSVDAPAGTISIATDLTAARRLSATRDAAHTTRRVRLVGRDDIGDRAALAADEPTVAGFDAILANTDTVLDWFERHGGPSGTYFVPAVDLSVIAPRPTPRGPADPRRDAPIEIVVRLDDNEGVARGDETLEDDGTLLDSVVLPAIELLRRRADQPVRVRTHGAILSRERRGDGMIHLGVLDPVDTAALYRSSVIGLVPSTSSGARSATLQMMACGLAVVAASDHVCSPVVHDGHDGLVVEAEAEAFCDALTRLTSDPELRTALGHGAGSRIAEHHSSWDVNLAGLIDVLSATEHAG